MHRDITPKESGRILDERAEVVPEAMQNERDYHQVNHNQNV